MRLCVTPVAGPPGQCKGSRGQCDDRFEELSDVRCGNIARSNRRIMSSKLVTVSRVSEVPEVAGSKTVCPTGLLFIFVLFCWVS